MVKTLNNINKKQERNNRRTNNTPFEGEDAAKATIARSACRRGPKRGARSMGRYPFLTYAEKYLHRRKASLATATLNQLGRRARYLAKELEQLKRDGKIMNTSPENLTEDDINEIILWMKSKGNGTNYQAKMMGFIKSICEFAGNGVFTHMKAGGIELPKMVIQDLDPMSEEEVRQIFEASDKMSGYVGDVARFLVRMYFFTGLRQSELRLAHFEDLNTRKWTIWVRHPKGEGRYGKQRKVPIVPPLRPYVMEYLEARKKIMTKKGKESEALIPSNRGKCYSANRLQVIKKNLEKIINMDCESGNFKFMWKDFRDSFCQFNIDKGVDVEIISVNMGHESPTTTVKHYGRMRPEKAMAALNAVYENDTTWSRQPQKAITVLYS